MSNNPISKAAMQQLLNSFGLSKPPAWMEAMPYGDFLEACKAERRRLNDDAARNARDERESWLAAQGLAQAQAQAAQDEAATMELIAKMQAEDKARLAGIAASQALAESLAALDIAEKMFQVQPPARAAPSAPAWDWSAPVRAAPAPVRAAPAPARGAEQREAFMRAARDRFALEAKEAAEQAWADEADAQCEAWEAEAQSAADHQMALALEAQSAADHQMALDLEARYAQVAQDALMAQALALARDAG